MASFQPCSTGSYMPEMAGSITPESDTIDPQVLVVHALQLRQQQGIASGSRGQQRRAALARRVAPVRRRGNLQRAADRLDPVTSAMLVDEGVHFL